jgi:hypothetical protein
MELAIESEIESVIGSEMGTLIGFDLATFHTQLYLVITKHSFNNMLRVRVSFRNI